MDAPPVRYLTTADGYSLAYTAAGEGEPLVISPSVYSHQELYWRQKTRITDWIQGLAARFRLIQYDGRGQGLSTRGLSADYAMADMVGDLAAIVDHLGLERFSLMSEGGHGHVIARYAAEHPDRVCALIFMSVPVSNAVWSRGYYETMARENWTAYLQAQAGAGTQEEIRETVDRMRQCITQEDWSRKVRVLLASDIFDIIPNLKMPALVLHPREYHQLPQEDAAMLASLLPDARLVLLDGYAWGDAERGVAAIVDLIRGATKTWSTAWLERVNPRTDAPASRYGDLSASPFADGLSARQREVLRLLAAGKSNAQIADELVISQNTVIRHVSNIFAKIGVENRAQAAVYARDHGIG